MQANDVNFLEALDHFNLEDPVLPAWHSLVLAQ